MKADLRMSLEKQKMKSTFIIIQLHDALDDEHIWPMTCSDGSNIDFGTKPIGVNSLLSKLFFWLFMHVCCGRCAIVCCFSQTNLSDQRKAEISLRCQSNA